VKTVTIYASPDSWTVSGASADYETAYSTATSHHQVFYPPEYLKDYDKYRVFRSFLRFDTSIIPEDATIINAQMRLTPYSVESGFDYLVYVVKQDWSAYDPIEAGNRDDAYDGSLAGIQDAHFRIFGENRHEPNVPMYSTFLDTRYINPTTDTYFSLRSNRDGSTDAPVAPEYIYFYTARATNPDYKPALIINYYETVEYSERMRYFLEVDWIGDQLESSWVDESDRLQKYVLDRGRDRTIGSPGRGFEQPQPGRLILTVDNTGGRYDPWNAGGELYGLIEPGKRLNLGCSHKGVYYALFTGFIEDIQISSYHDIATITAKDAAGWLRDRIPEIPIIESEGVDTAINTILDRLKYPFGRIVETGINTLDHYWSTGKNALLEIHDLATADMGRFCVDANGAARFRGRNNSDAIEHTLDEDVLGKNIYIPMPWDYTRYIVDVYAYPQMVGLTNETLWTLREAVNVPPNKSITLRAPYTYNGQRVVGKNVYIDSFAPSGIFNSSNFTLLNYSREAVIKIERPGGGRLTELVLKGTPIYMPDETVVREEMASETVPAAFVFDYPWLTNPNTAKDYADILLAYLSEPKMFPAITIYNRPDKGCAIDLEERVRLKLDTLGVDETYFVNKVSHRSGASMQEIITTIKLNPMLQDQSENVFILDSATNGLLDTNELGF